MKKIFTLFIATGMITLAQAQPGNRDNRQSNRRDDPTDQRSNQPIDQRDQNNRYGDGKDVVVNQNPYNNKDDRFGNNDDRFDNNDFRYGSSSFGNERRMKMQIAQINREYDYKIEKVKCSFFTSRWEKQRQIRFLEEQRQREIRMVYIKFKSQGNRYDERDNRNH